MTRIAIIGGGISGLAAAFASKNTAAPAQSNTPFTNHRPNLGGVLRTEHIEGCIVEAGPDSFITEKPWAADLCRTLGLGDQLIGSNDADRKTYILVRGRLIPMPDGLMFMVPTKILPTGFSPLFSWTTKLRMAQELFHPTAHRRSRRKRRVLSRAPLRRGNGRPPRRSAPLRRLRRRSRQPQRSRRSSPLRRNGAHSRQSRPRHAGGKKKNAAPGKPTRPSALHFSQERHAATRRNPRPAPELSPPCVTNHSVQSIQPEAGGWTVSAGLKSDHFDAVILAVPTHAAAQAPVASAAPNSPPNWPPSATALPSPSASATIAKSANHSLPASDFSSRAAKASACWPQLSSTTNSPTALPKTAPCCAASSPDRPPKTSGSYPTTPSSPSSATNCSRSSASAPQPLFARVYKWKSAMAQYGVGHLERLDRIERLRQQLPGLALAGNGYRGIGVPDCIRSGQEAAKQLLNC